MTNIEVGKVYEVTHSRKGKFVMRVDSVDDEWLTGTITEGTARAIMEYNIKSVEEAVTVRRSFCTFKSMESI